VSELPWTLVPLACLAGSAFAVYLLARLLHAPNSALAACTAIAFALACATIVYLVVERPVETAWAGWHTVLQRDPGALYVASIATALGGLVAIYSGRYMVHDPRYETYYPLLLLLAAGLVGMVMSGDLFSTYLFCELMSISTYALVAFRRHTDTAIEAGFKYLIMGSVGTTLALMGISFVYRAQGTLQLVTVDGTLTALQMGWKRAGLVCLIVGLGIKSAVVPLHTWLPDAHGRAPSSISAMLSGIVIQSVLYTTIKISLSLGLPASILGALLVVFALLNMTLGNVMALVQTNTKRLLAYSSIAQTGYLMLGIGVGLKQGLPAAIQAGCLMLMAHTVMKAAAFLTKGICHFYTGTTDISQLRGLARSQPLLGFCFSLALAGLAGVPPLAGFVGKWTTLTQSLQRANWLTYVAIVVFALNGLVALGYYLTLIGTLFAQPDPDEAAASCPRPARLSAWMVVPLIVLVALVIAIGIYPAPWLQWSAGVGPYLLALGGE